MSEFDTSQDIQTVSTLEETDKKCPSCGGVMDFDPKTGGLLCPYCGHTQEIAVKEDEPTQAGELSFDTAVNKENCNWGAAKKTVVCKACGAESVYDALEISAVCPFCGSNQVMEAADQNTIAPGGVVPFQYSDEQAADLFKSWIKKKFFCPKLAKESAKAKSFKGVYLPYWTFDAQSNSTYRGEYGIDRRVKENGEEKTVTDWKRCSGHYSEFFNDELVCATTNQNRSMLRGIEPFRTEENKAYKPEYVAGYAAERYAVGLKEGWNIAKQSMDAKIRSGVTNKIHQDYHADSTRNIQISSSFSNLTYKYLLLPVWMSSYKYKDKVYNFMVNGQTGKVSGKTPVSVPKVIITVLGCIAAAALIYYLMH